MTGWNLARRPGGLVGRDALSYGVVSGAYALATWFTDAYFMGDTWIYVTDLLRAERLRDSFWDFGHALWLPFVWLVARLVHAVPFSPIAGDAREDASLTFLGISWVAGLVCVILVYSLARRFCERSWTAYLVTAVFLFSNTVLNYAQTGQPYIPGLAMLLLGLLVLLSDGDPVRRPVRTALCAGSALAMGVCLWVAYVLSIPALVLCPLILFGPDRSRLRVTLVTGLVFALVAGLVYGAMIVNLGIGDVAGIGEWIRSSTHGVSPDAPLKAMERMVFSLGRTLVNMGNDGRLFKQYLVRDPFNPVSLVDLVRPSLLKLALFYLLVSWMVVTLVATRRGRRTVVLLLLGVVPVVTFALFVFESGSIDRYLPLFPVFLLALSVSVSDDGPGRWARLVTLVFVVVTAVSNIGAMSTVALGRQQEAVVARVRDLVPLLRSGSLVVTVNQQDELYAFHQNFPFHPLNRSGRLHADFLIDPGTTQVRGWQQIFAGKTLARWDKGGDVWITRRVLSAHPRPDWNWVEGDDPRVSWTEIHRFFGGMEIGQTLGGEDGFILVPPSPGNAQLLRELGGKRS